jgi:Predicted O-methyltransferase
MEHAVRTELAVPTPECPRPERWSCYDSQSAELEILALLTALVTATKPHLVLETGCYLGHSTLALARGLQTNGHGYLYTCDTVRAHAQATEGALRRDGLSAWAETQVCEGLQLIRRLAKENYSVDFAFLDSDQHARQAELIELWNLMRPGGLIVIHDTNTHHDKSSGLRTFVFDWLRARVAEFLHLDTPRGLVLVRR